jgi:hypothetical protein
MLNLNDRLMRCLKITGCYIHLLADGSYTEPKLQFVCIHLAYISAHTQHHSTVYMCTLHVLLTALCSFVRRSGIYWTQINNFWHVRQEATNVSRETASSTFTALPGSAGSSSSDTFFPNAFCSGTSRYGAPKISVTVKHYMNIIGYVHNSEEILNIMLLSFQ